MPKKRKSVKKKRGSSCKSSGMPGPARQPHLHQDQLLSCVGQLINWLNLYKGQVASALTCYEQQESGQALWQDFTLCLTTMHAPITPRGLALLQPLLDPQDSGLVDVNSLYSDLLAHQRWLTLGKGMSREAEVCGNCGLRLPQPPLDPSPSYVELHMTLAPFASISSHPGHVTYLLPSSTTILSLQHQLHSSLGAMATAVAIFSEVKVQPSSRLPPHSSLMEVGVAGGEKTTPTKATLYYDYIPASVQCPVVMTDHYYLHVPVSLKIAIPTMHVHMYS